MTKMFYSINCCLFHCVRIHKRTRYHRKYFRHIPSPSHVQSISTYYRHPDLNQKKLSHIVECRRLVSLTACGKNKWQQFIEENTEISHDHLTPEITLRLITPRCHLWSMPYSQCEEAGVSDPYWAFYWPGGQALTRFLLDNPEIIRGKDVLDIGSGCGASAIACVKAGADKVTANDIDPVSIQAINMNAALNHVTMDTSVNNLIGRPITNWDTVLLGDMFYDDDFTNMVSGWLKYLSSKQISVFIGDPGRFYLKNHPIKNQLVKVFEVELPEQSRLENNGLTQGFVWQLKCDR